LIFLNEKPAHGPEQQQQYNQIHDALTYYIIKDGKLFRKGTAKDNIPGVDRDVVRPADIVYKIQAVHTQLGHAGMNKTTIGVRDRYYGITRTEVEWLLKHCQTCLLSWQNRSRALLEPIVSDHTLQRMQIDLVDLRHEPDEQFKWILHIKDHFSKWLSLFPLKSKTAGEVSGQMAIWIGYYGVPEILQCDNGREFKGILLILLQKHEIKVRNGRPRTPQTQGLVEQANGTMKTKLRAWKLDTVASGGNPHCWSQALPEIALSINRQPHASLGGRLPYEVMFNQKPSWEEAIPIHSRLQQTLDNIPEELVHLGSGIQDQRDEEADMLVETLPPAINAGALGTGFSFDDMDYSRMSDAGWSPVPEPELEVENHWQALPIPDIHSSPVSIENTIVRTVLEKAMQDEAAKARARSSHKYNKQHTIERFLAGDIVSLKIPREDRAATDPPRIFC